MEKVDNTTDEAGEGQSSGGSTADWAVNVALNIMRDIQAAACPPLFATTAVRRMAEDMFAANAMFDAGEWGDISAEQAEHNDTTNSGVIFGRYPGKRGESFYLIQFPCYCDHWCSFDHTRWMKVACTERELLLATCPCIWESVPENVRPKTFPAMTPDERLALEKLLHHTFDSEAAHYATCTEAQQATHVLHSAAIVEGWLNATPDPVTIMRNAVGIFVDESEEQD